MSIRQKIVGSAVIVFLATTVVTIMATVLLVQAEYVRIEANSTKKDTARAVDAVHNRIDQLALKIPDWSSWDDTYQFIQDHNQAYLTSNVQNDALKSLTINIMLFYNAKDQLVSSKSINIQTGNDAPLPPALLQALTPGSTLLAHQASSAQQGLLATSTYPLIVVTRPILRTDGSGPVRGTLVFAQYLDAAGIIQLGELTHLKISYDYAMERGALTAEAVKCPGKTACTQTANAQTITGFQVFNDIYGHPLLVMKVTEARTIYQETRRTLVLYVGIILAAGLMSLVTAFITVNVIVRRDHVIQLKNEFFSIASHELRTPLAAIRGNSVALQRRYGDKIDAEFSATVADIHEASVRLIKIVNDFLDLARLERNQMPMDIKPIKLADPVLTVAQELQSLADEKHLYIKTELPSTLPAVIADSERVQQIIYNLAGNAMKFTAQGGVTIAAAARYRQVVIFITDTGRGMSADEQKNLFKSFEQSREQDATIGSGLGLYISKLLVERMGGRIWVESSQCDKGTTLAFSLPADRQQKLQA